MKRYRVAGGVAHIGQGDLVEISGEQLAPRAHNVDVVKRAADDRIVVRAKQQLQFKVGEEIGLPDLPKYLVDILVPLEPPQSAADDVALDREEGRKAQRAGRKPPAPKAPRKKAAARRKAAGK